MEPTSAVTREHPNAYSYSSRTYDGLVFEVVSFTDPPYNGPTEPGIYDLRSTNYETCGLCIRGFRGCLHPFPCTEDYYADQGTVIIDSMDPFSGVLQDVVLTQVVIDPTTFRSTPTPNAKTWCFDDFVFADIAGPR